MQKNRNIGTETLNYIYTTNRFKVGNGWKRNGVTQFIYGHFWSLFIYYTYHYFQLPITKCSMKSKVKRGSQIVIAVSR